ncbi:Hypoxia induced protein conserved region [Flavobacterium cucumis]|uniref:Uncharacterized protein n=1 Tax=Flavobacterium cucumis TaxID=416016 RepID=A0A1M7ZZ98_9FLAO|nr:hypothetical protein SAMN05443547_2586 [Flavobacterium cucumis]
MKKLFIYLAVVFFVLFLISIVKFNYDKTETMYWNTIRIQFSIQAILLLFASIVLMIIHFFIKK